MVTSPMQKKSPIPISRTIILREFWQKVVPVMVFAGVVGVCLWLWGPHIAGGQASGIAEGVRSVVTSPRVALLHDLRVSPYEWVEAGQPLATLIPSDPRETLDLLQAELTIARMQLEPSVADRNALDFEQVRVELMRLQQELAVAKVNLERAEKVLARNTALLKDQLVSEDTYDFSVNERDMYREDVANKGLAVEEIQQRMEALRAIGEPLAGITNQFVTGLLGSVEARLASAYTNAAPFVLKAPMSGMVHYISRQPGEYVAEGEPLLAVHSDRAERIIAYLRQPYGIDPQPGQPVEVTTRTHHRHRFKTEVVQVGAQLEAITNSLAFLKPGMTVDAGLPVVLRVPPETRIRPGEVVDVIFLPRDTHDDTSDPGQTRVTSRAN